MFGNTMSAVAEQHNVEFEYDSDADGYAAWVAEMYGECAVRDGGEYADEDDQQGEQADDDAGGQHVRRVTIEASSAGT